MKRTITIYRLALGITALLAGMLVSGCHSASHPDDKAAVYNVLSKNDLASVEVTQDRGSGTITLKGIVGSTDQRTKAENLARQAAPDYTVSNQLTVDNTGITSMAKPNAPQPEVKTVPSSQAGAKH
jgi:osmotically-inducible protein OsmY